MYVIKLNDTIGAVAKKLISARNEYLYGLQRAVQGYVYIFVNCTHGIGVTRQRKKLRISTNISIRNENVSTLLFLYEFGVNKKYKTEFGNSPSPL